ncbi:MAG: VOC family protein [Acidobacteria bacterium]|nr:VOC family protein [Acidobacteriota bacterium]
MESPITGFSHLQMNVRDLATSRVWFETVLGMEAFVELDDTVALRHRPSRLVLVLSQREIDPDSPSPLDHLAFAVPDGETLEAWAQELTVRGIAHDGVVLELGKPSLQLRDPDGNAIELVAPAPRT